ncbi:hypothetical protein D3C75_911350 [compost metagenome]
MALHNMAAEPLLCSHGPLQIDRIAGTQLPQIGLAVGFRHNIRRKGPAVEGHNRQTNAIDGNAVADGHILQHLGGFHRQQHGLSLPVHPAHSSHFFYNSCKHGAPSSLKANSPGQAHSGDIR